MGTAWNPDQISCVGKMLAEGERAREREKESKKESERDHLSKTVVQLCSHKQSHVRDTVGLGCPEPSNS